MDRISTDWRDAWIVPVFKKDDMHKPANNRPMSLTSITYKLLEHIVHSNVMAHIDKYNILKDNQYGFPKKRSPASILYKSIAGRYRPVSYPDESITARYIFIKDVCWVMWDTTSHYYTVNCIQTCQRGPSGCHIVGFQKAFDKVARTRLLYKLEYYVVRGIVLNWSRAFLSKKKNRKVVL